MCQSINLVSYRKVLEHLNLGIRKSIGSKDIEKKIKSIYGESYSCIGKFIVSVDVASASLKLNYNLKYIDLQDI